MFLDLVLSERNPKLKFSYYPQESLRPDVTVVVPVFNQASIIEKHLKSILDSLTSNFELLIINDNSDDDTEIVIKRTLEEYVNSIPTASPNCAGIQFFTNRISWFETRCDDYCFRKAKAPILIEIQADMLIREIGFDQELIEVLRSDSKLFAVSARGGHSLNLVYANILKMQGSDIPDRIYSFRIIKKIRFKIRKLLFKIKKSPIEVTPSSIGRITGMGMSEYVKEVFPHNSKKSLYEAAGWLNELIALLPYEGENVISRQIHAHKKEVWLTETINRGPLALKKDLYLELGGLDTRAFFQGNDDHDLFTRAASFGLKVGFTPISFSAPIGLGSARKRRKLSSKLWSKFNRRIRKKHLANSALYKSALVKSTG
jgi:glycosyltransferase involved in cell wall biosynthesis